jgi:hypothetical protein
MSTFNDKLILANVACGCILCRCGGAQSQSENQRRESCTLLLGFSMVGGCAMVVAGITQLPQPFLLMIGIALLVLPVPMVYVLAACAQCSMHDEENRQTKRRVVTTQVITANQNQITILDKNGVPVGVPVQSGAAASMPDVPPVVDRP